MKDKKAMRVKFKVDNLWESPPMHILLKREDDVIVARCLDLTVSSHGNDEKDAINSLSEAVKEAILSAFSLASAPEFAKKTLSANDFSTKSLARSAWGWV